MRSIRNSRFHAEVAAAVEGYLECDPALAVYAANWLLQAYPIACTFYVNLRDMDSGTNLVEFSDLRRFCDALVRPGVSGVIWLGLDIAFVNASGVTEIVETERSPI